MLRAQSRKLQNSTLQQFYYKSLCEITKFFNLLVQLQHYLMRQTIFKTQCLFRYFRFHLPEECGNQNLRVKMDAIGRILLCYSPQNMKLKKQYCFGEFRDTKILFARIVKPTQVQNVLQSLLDPQALRNLKYINPILRNSNLKDARFGHFCLILRENAEKQAKMLKSCFL